MGLPDFQRLLPTHIIQLKSMVNITEVVRFAAGYLGTLEYKKINISTAISTGLCRQKGTLGSFGEALPRVSQG